MIINKIIILLYISTIIGWSNILLSQTYEKYYVTPEDELVYDAIIANPSTCIFSLNHGNFDSDLYATKFFKMDIQSGVFTDSLMIEPTYQDFLFRGIYDLLKANDSLFIGIGKFKIDGSGEEPQYIVHFNNNLEVTFDTVVDMIEIRERYHKSILTSDDLLLSVGVELDSGKMLLCEKNYYGEPIRYETYIHSTSLIATTVMDIPYNNEYHLFIYGGIEHSFDVIDKTSLEIDTTIEYSQQFLPIDAVDDQFSDSIYYTAGKQGVSGSSNYDLSFLKINKNDYSIDQYTFSEINNMLYTYKCLSPTLMHIYFGGVVPFTPNPPLLYPEERFILCYKLKKDGSVIWQKFYKGGVNYMVYKILATDDDGALLFSSKYDWNDPIPMQRDVHILKIDSTGYYNPLTGTGEELEQITKQILVYPNPAKDKVQFVFGLYHDLDISIFNLVGELILSENYKHSATIDISRLPAGTYIYKITGGNGFFEEGKLVKQ